MEDFKLIIFVLFEMVEFLSCGKLLKFNLVGMVGVEDYDLLCDEMEESWIVVMLRWKYFGLVKRWLVFLFLLIYVRVLLVCKSILILNFDVLII